MVARLEKGTGRFCAKQPVPARRDSGEMYMSPFPAERKVRAPQGTVVGNAHRPRNGRVGNDRVRRRTGKVQQRVDRLRGRGKEGDR